MLDEVVAYHSRAVMLQPERVALRANLASALHVLRAVFRLLGFQRQAEAA